MSVDILPLRAFVLKKGRKTNIYIAYILYNRRKNKREKKPNFKGVIVLKVFVLHNGGKTVKRR